MKTIVERHLAGDDVLIAEGTPRTPMLLVSDMDSTMIGQECIDELADFAGMKPQVSAITERAMRGEIDFAAALHERVALLAGLDETVIDRCLAERITPMPGARELVAGLRARGCRTVLVTGGFHHFAVPVARMLGFDRVVGNRLAVSGGKLTGIVTGDIVTAQTKRRVLLEAAAELPGGAAILATGDGANDVPMLQAATYGMAYHAKPAAKAAGDGWIARGDLTNILRLLDITPAASD